MLHGMFAPGQFGTFPEEHSQSGIRPYLGSGLPDVESYDDLFLMRNPAYRWLLDSRPRDALNTHDSRAQSGYPALSHETIMDKPEGARKQQTTKWYINTYLHADDPDTLPLGEDVLDGLQFGGKRNYGYGITRLKDTQVVGLNDRDYSRLEDGEALLVEVTTPFVLESEYPKPPIRMSRDGGRRVDAIFVSERRRSSSNGRSTSSRPSTTDRS
nr:hypothetical protein [Salinarchaeum sp. IM2453]